MNLFKIIKSWFKKDDPKIDDWNVSWFNSFKRTTYDPSKYVKEEAFDLNGNKIFHRENGIYWWMKAYDLQNNVIKYVDSNNRIIDYKYDDHNHLKEKKIGDFVEYYKYDEKGRLLRHSSSNGTWYGYTYDEEGNRISYEDCYGRKEFY